MNRLCKEALFFVYKVILSLLFIFVLAIVADRQILAPECLYEKETYAFLLSMGFLYFIRLIVWMA